MLDNTKETINEREAKRCTQHRVGNTEDRLSFFYTLLNKHYSQNSDSLSSIECKNKQQQQQQQQ